MSEQVYQPDHKPVFTESTLSYFGVLGAVAVAAAVFAIAYGLQASDTKPVNESLNAQRIALRGQIEGASRKLISEYGKNADGTYRIPADKAIELIVSEPSALNAARGVSAAK